MQGDGITNFKVLYLIDKCGFNEKMNTSDHLSKTKVVEPHYKNQNRTHTDNKE